MQNVIRNPEPGVASASTATPAQPHAASETLADVLGRHTAVGSLWRAEGERIRCVACGHRCLIGPGRHGICRVRFNQDGQLRVPFGYVAGVQCDPVEKKPFFHVYPGTDALTFGMMGCDFHCSYCQNWVTSQALRDDAARAPIRDRHAAATGAHGPAIRRAAGGVQLQRAAHHRGMGRGRLSAGEGSRAGLRLCLEWQRHPRGAGFPPPVDRRLQD